MKSLLTKLWLQSNLVIITKITMLHSRLQIVEVTHIKIYIDPDILKNISKYICKKW